MKDGLMLKLSNELDAMSELSVLTTLIRAALLMMADSGMVHDASGKPAAQEPAVVQSWNALAMTRSEGSSRKSLVAPSLSQMTLTFATYPFVVQVIPGDAGFWFAYQIRAGLLSGFVMSSLALMVNGADWTPCLSGSLMSWTRTTTFAFF